MVNCSDAIIERRGLGQRVGSQLGVTFDEMPSGLPYKG
jgi:hypothetical protein